MKFSDDVKVLLERCETQLRTLSSIANDEQKEYGKAKDDTIIRFNAIMFAIDSAGDTLEKGLNGEF